MKFNWIVLLLASMACHSAMASKARLTALGQDAGGSLFIEDARNIFLNPALLNKYANRVNLEWGSQSVSNTPKGEGGLSYAADSLTFGLQLGRVSNATQSIINNQSLGTGSDFLLPQNSIDLLVAGPQGSNWGASVHYAYSSREEGANSGDYPDGTARVVSLRGGYYQDAFTVYGLLDVMHESETDESAVVTEKYEGDISLEAGGSYDLDAQAKVGVQAVRRAFSFDNGAGSEGDATNLEVTAVYHRNLFSTNELLLFYSGGLGYTDAVYEFDGAGVEDTKIGTLFIPVTLGLEKPVREWMTLRGSVRQNVLLDQSKSSSTSTDIETDGTDDTTVTAGLSLFFDGFIVDATFAGSGNAGTGNLDANELMANVGMEYAF